MSLDMTESIAPRSDQQNFDDYLSGPRTVTVADVQRGSAEQPIDVHLVEYPGRPFKPSKSMRRVLVAAWGADAGKYSGRRMTLVGDPTVRFGGATVGGVRISHLSHIDKRLTLSLTTTRGKRAPYVVEPLPDLPATPAAGITEAQSKTLIAGLKLVGLTDRDAALAYVCKQIGRTVGGTKELTQDEAAAVIADLADPKADAATGDMVPLIDLPAGWDDVDVAAPGGAG